MQWDNGDRYVGSFEKGRAHGNGSLNIRRKSRVKYIGTFDNGSIATGSAEYYTHKAHGIQLSQDQLHHTYKGDFVDGLPHGTGEIEYTRVAGRGYYGKKLEGNFERGDIQGEAKITYPKGGNLVVNHVNGERHGKGEYTSPDGATEEWTYHNGSFVEHEANGQYYKEAANKPKDNLISTALKLQGLVSTINRVSAKRSGRKFIGTGSPPPNSFDANNQPNAKYFKWAYGE